MHDNKPIGIIGFDLRTLMANHGVFYGKRMKPEFFLKKRKVLDGRRYGIEPDKCASRMQKVANASKIFRPWNRLAVTIDAQLHCIERHPLLRGSYIPEMRSLSRRAAHFRAFL